MNKHKTFEEVLYENKILREVCRVAYNFVADRGGDTKMLDNLVAAFEGESLPHPIEEGYSDEWDWACGHTAQTACAECLRLARE